MKKNYTPYHVHSDRSLLDSCTKFKEYIDLAVKNNMSAICFTEHGNLYNHIEKRLYCDEKGIKYLHGCEVYLTRNHEEKLRDNLHTILIAKNSEGYKELNSLIDLSTKEDHFYYKNRLSFDEFLNISDNIIKISACLASPLNRLEDEDIYLEKLLKHYDYYEIQYHNIPEQIKYNKKLFKWSQMYNKPLITGTDTHSSTKYKSECRAILKKGKKMSYDNEDSYDLSFKTYEELVEKFKSQNSLPINIVLEAIENTNVMANSTEVMPLDNTIKYPKVSDDDDKAFLNTVYKKCGEKIESNIIDKKNKKYLEQLKEEIRVLKKLDMYGFMLSMSDFCSWSKENGYPIGFGRGSSAGSLVSFLLDITDVDPIKNKLSFARFANEHRTEVGD